MIVNQDICLRSKILGSMTFIEQTQRNYNNIHLGHYISSAQTTIIVMAENLQKELLFLMYKTCITFKLKILHLTWTDLA